MNKTAIKYQNLIPLLLLAFMLYTPNSKATSYNGFDVSNSSIPTNEIHRGGPPRDGIPAIDKPQFLPAEKTKYLKASDRVLGLSRNNISKVYPISIMNWHEIVNDELGDEKIVVTFCPLCGTGVAFSASAGGKTLNFGVSGLLYNSDVLLYDRETESLWSQLLTRAISGPLLNTSLTLVALEHTTWADWRRRHPNTLVLSTNTGYSRDYTRDPYAGYEDSHGIYFPVSHRDRRFHPKERVLGVEINGVFKAYPFAELSQTNGTIHDELNNKKIIIHYDSKSHSARLTSTDGKAIPAITAYWFAWITFHPDTLVFNALKNSK